MEGKVSPNVKEGWTGPGRRDGVITPLKPEDDALHIELGKRNQFEWWYFDAHLEGGYTVVAFFHAANPNPGIANHDGVSAEESGTTLHEIVAFKPILKE